MVGSGRVRETILPHDRAPERLCFNRAGPLTPTSRRLCGCDEEENTTCDDGPTSLARGPTPSARVFRQRTGAFFYANGEQPPPASDVYVRMASRKIFVSSFRETSLPGSFSFSTPGSPDLHYCHKHQSSRTLIPPYGLNNGADLGGEARHGTRGMQSPRDIQPCQQAHRIVTDAVISSSATAHCKRTRFFIARCHPTRRAKKCAPRAPRTPRAPRAPRTPRPTHPADRLRRLTGRVEPPDRWDLHASEAEPTGSFQADFSERYGENRQAR